MTFTERGSRADFGWRHFTSFIPKRSISREGEILNAVEENGLKNTTFTYFTSDHGGHLEARDEHSQLGGWNGIYRGKTGGCGRLRSCYQPNDSAPREGWRRAGSDNEGALSKRISWASTLDHVLLQCQDRETKTQGVPFQGSYFSKRDIYK